MIAAPLNCSDVSPVLVQAAGPGVVFVNAIGAYVGWPANRPDVTVPLTTTTLPTPVNEVPAVG